MKQAQLVLLRLESAAAKTEYVSYNQLEGNLVTLKGDMLKEVEDSVSWILGGLLKKGQVQIGMAWSA